jgi:hypothetical protein
MLEATLGHADFVRHIPGSRRLSVRLGRAEGASASASMADESI